MRISKRLCILIIFFQVSLPAWAQHTVTLTWTASTDGAANLTSGYNILRGTASGAESSTPIATAQALGCPTSTACTYVDSSSAVVAGATLYYEVVFVVGSASSAPSNQAMLRSP